MNGDKYLHLYNVSLPLYEKDDFFHIVIKNGKYRNIERQSVHFETNAVPLSEMTMEQLDKQSLIDIEGRWLLPSFVDVHTHLDKAFSLRSVPNKSGTLQEAITNYSKRAHLFTSTEIKQRVIRAALQSLSHGTSCIRTHVNFELDVSKEVTLQSLQAVIEAKYALSPMMSVQIVPMFSNLSTRTKKELEIVEEAIALGIDGIGGAPHLSPHAGKDIDALFHLAMKYDTFIDLHVDEQDNPNVCTIAHIIQKTREHDYQGRVVAGHLCSLAAMERKKAYSIIESMEKEKIGAVTLPGANMYLQGRSDKGIVRRGITRVKELIENGVMVSAASDNVNDPFHPFGRGDLLQIGLLTAYTAHLASEKELYDVLRMITNVPAKLFGIDHYGVKEEATAQFVIVDTNDIYDLFASLSPTRYVHVNGQWVSVMKSETQFGNHQIASLWQSVKKEDVNLV